MSSISGARESEVSEAVKKHRLIGKGPNSPEREKRTREAPPPEATAAGGSQDGRSAKPKKKPQTDVGKFMQEKDAVLAALEATKNEWLGVDPPGIKQKFQKLAATFAEKKASTTDLPSTVPEMSTSITKAGAAIEQLIGRVTETDRSAWGLMFKERDTVLARLAEVRLKVDAMSEGMAHRLSNTRTKGRSKYQTERWVVVKCRDTFAPATSANVGELLGEKVLAFSKQEEHAMRFHGDLKRGVAAGSFAKKFLTIGDGKNDVFAEMAKYMTSKKQIMDAAAEEVRQFIMNSAKEVTGAVSSVPDSSGYAAGMKPFSTEFDHTSPGSSAWILGLKSNHARVGAADVPTPGVGHVYYMHSGDPCLILALHVAEIAKGGGLLPEVLQWFRTQTALRIMKEKAVILPLTKGEYLWIPHGMFVVVAQYSPSTRKLKAPLSASVIVAVPCFDKGELAKIPANCLEGMRTISKDVFDTKAGSPMWTQRKATFDTCFTPAE